MEHVVRTSLLERQVCIALVGAGGTGSQILTGLARLHLAMVALGHPGGLHVVTADGDRVSRSNVGRQLFSPSDVGEYKSVVLTHRVNVFFGLGWNAHPEYISDGERFENVDIVIGCVDTRKARRVLHGCLTGGGSFREKPYWLDIGNTADAGQVILGEPVANGKDWHLRLPTVTELFPDILDGLFDGKDEGPSCGLAEALERQELFVNQGVATFALNLLWSLFRRGRIEHHGAFLNMRTGMVKPMPVDPETWKRFGHRTKRQPARRNARRRAA